MRLILVAMATFVAVTAASSQEVQLQTAECVSNPQHAMQLCPELFDPKRFGSDKLTFTAFVPYRTVQIKIIPLRERIAESDQ